MNTQEYLNAIVTIIVDRPLRSQHPRHGFTYPVNYGYVPHTTSGDGEELDAYILGVFEPLSTFTGRCIAIIHRTNDDDDKLIVAPPGISLTNQEIREATHFQEQWFKSIILRENAPQDE